MLAVGVWYGLARLGWTASATRPDLMLAHGPLMVTGFVGTVVGLERAAALGRRWTYAAPALAALSSVVLLAGLPPELAALLAVAAALVLTTAYASILSRQWSVFGAIMALGAVLWGVGNVLWLAGLGLRIVTGWWSAFLVLTIAGERFELGRIAHPPAWARTLFLAAVLVVTLGLVAATAANAVLPERADLAHVPYGLGLVVIAAWLARFDVVRRTVRSDGLSRYIAVALLCAYAWLAVAGAVTAAAGGGWEGRTYDAAVHAVMIGFVLSVVFGHAPIVFPVLLGRPPVYSSSLYAPLAALHLSVALRVGGDLVGLSPAWRWGALLNAAAVLLFAATIAPAIARSARPACARPVGSPRRLVGDGT
jgi:hypothetical protein